MVREKQMPDWIDNEAFWDILKSANKLLSCADTESELLSIEKALCYEIRCITAAAYENGIIGHMKCD